MFMQPDPQRPERIDPEPFEGADDHSWAQASGWAQLSGTRHTLSCVLVGTCSAPGLQALLPTLSDTLTECGYPWEIVLAVPPGGGGILGPLRDWSGAPGFRCIDVVGPAASTNALSAGLAATRGEVVILLDATLARSTGLIARAVALWEAGAWQVRAHCGAAGRGGEYRQWNEAETLQGRGDVPSHALPDNMQLCLFDRRWLDRLRHVV